MHKIALAKSDEEIANCFPVTIELRPRLSGVNEFLERVKRQQANYEYKLAFLESAAEVKSVAGFRIVECPAYRKTLSLDDLATRSGERSKGYGQVLFDWVVNYARENECDEFHLNSGVHRFAAHRFYLQKRMNFICHHSA